MIKAPDDGAGPSRRRGALIALDLRQSIKLRRAADNWNNLKGASFKSSAGPLILTPLTLRLWPDPAGAAFVKR